MVKIDNADPLLLEDTEDKQELITLATPKIRLEYLHNALLPHRTDAQIVSWLDGVSTKENYGKTNSGNSSYNDGVWFGNDGARGLNTANLDGLAFNVKTGTKAGMDWMTLSAELCRNALAFFEIVQYHGYHRTGAAATTVLSNTNLANAAPAVTNTRLTHSSGSSVWDVFTASFMKGFDREIDTVTSAQISRSDSDGNDVDNGQVIGLLRNLGYFCGSTARNDLPSPKGFDQPELFRYVSAWTQAAIWMYNLGMMMPLAIGQSDMANVVVARLRSGAVPGIINLGKEINDEVSKEAFGYLVRAAYNSEDIGGNSNAIALVKNLLKADDIGENALEFLTDNQDMALSVPTYALNFARKYYGYGNIEWGGSQRYFMHIASIGQKMSDYAQDDRQVGYGLLYCIKFIEKFSARFNLALAHFQQKRHYSWDDLTSLVSSITQGFKLSDLNGIADPNTYTAVRTMFTLDDSTNKTGPSAPERLNSGAFENIITVGYDLDASHRGYFMQWRPDATVNNSPDGNHGKANVLSEILTDLQIGATDLSKMIYTTAYSTMGELADAMFLHMLFGIGEADGENNNAADSEYPVSLRYGWFNPHMMIAARAVFNRTGLFHSYQLTRATSSDNTMGDWWFENDQDELYSTFVSARRTFAPDFAKLYTNMGTLPSAKRIYNYISDKRFEFADFIMQINSKPSVTAQSETVPEPVISKPSEVADVEEDEEASS